MRKIQDGYFRRAKREGYLARSAYKLEAIDKKFRLFRPGAAVLDLGSSPGSWIQYLRRAVGEKGRIAGVDLQPVKPAVRAMAAVLQKDVFACEPGDFREVAERFDAVVSDLAPATTGVRLADQSASLELAEKARVLAQAVLAPGGCFVCKLFESPLVAEFVGRVKKRFRKARLYKPPASRGESFETFLVARGFGPSAPEKASPPRRGRRRRSPPSPGGHPPPSMPK
ncbi:MAG: RlmE family RNA methyltransferase [Planctomycetota bacterium]